jgi:hypothetical protein
MKKQGTVEQLLRKALPAIGDSAKSSPDLWPEMQRRMRAESGALVPEKLHVPWFDWALAGGLAVSLALFPAWIPVLLYYL